MSKKPGLSNQDFLRAISGLVREDFTNQPPAGPSDEDGLRADICKLASQLAEPDRAHVPENPAETLNYPRLFQYFLK